MTHPELLQGSVPPAPPADDLDTVLELVGVNKYYPGVHALKNVSLTVRRGEVHALVGENGAGKSTLVGIAAGSVVADTGTVAIGGVVGASMTPGWSREQGLAIVYQEPALLPDLTVAENMALAMPHSHRPAIGKQVEWAEEILARWRKVVSIDPRTPVRELQPDGRFVVEIARALAEKPKVIVLDEPTEHLLPPAVAELFELIAELVKDGGSVVYISHRLNEVKRIADTVSVLRDGALVGTFQGSDVSEQDVVNLVVGKELDLGAVRARVESAAKGETLLKVEDFHGRGFHGVNFSVRAGEIIGFAGIEGQGQRDVIRALGGLGHGASPVEIDGKRITPRNSKVAQRNGIVYLPHDRHHEGVLGGLGLRENAAISSLTRFARLGVVSRRQERKATNEEFAALRVKTPGPEVDINTLSGGNQQKVVLSRVLLTQGKLILADEPTQGVDIGAREEIYGILRRAAANGAAIIVLSSSAAELEQLCDRVIVFSRGTAAAELFGDEVSEHGIARAALSATGSRSKSTAVEAKDSLRRRLSRSDLTPAAILIALTLLLGVVAVSQNSFYLTGRNLGLVLPLVATLAFFAMAQQIVMLVGGIDISVGPLGGLLVVVGSFVLAAYRSPAGMIIGVLILVVVAAAVGLLNWTLVLIVKINPLIATLVTYTALQGVAFLLRPLPAGQIDPTFISYVTGKLGFVPYMMILAIVVAIVLEVMLRRNRLGILARGVGSKPDTAARVGIRTRWIVLLAYVGCSIMVVPAAMLLMAQAGTGNATIGDSYTLASIGAVVLGGASIFGGRGSFIGALAGAILVIQINTVVQFLGLELFWQQWLLGGLTLVAAGLYSKFRTLPERG